MFSHDSAIEKEYVIRLKNGAEDAFVSLYSLYKSRIYYNLLRLVKTPEIAEELLQDVFMKVWEHRQQIDAEQPFKAYLYRIASNLAMDFYRKASKDRRIREQLVHFTIEGYEHIESGIIATEDAARLEAAISTLPEKRQRIFRLCRIEGKSYQEVAEQLGISSGTVKDHLVKAGRSLRQQLQTEYKLYAQVLLIACYLE